MPHFSEILSPKKREFLEEQFYTDLRLTLNDVFILAEEYNQKHKITIYVTRHLEEKGIVVERFFEDETYLSEENSKNESINEDEDEDEDDYDPIDEPDYDPVKDTYATINALNDILSIQKTLLDGQYVGYLYAMRDDGHFECFIISKYQIIKPISWLIGGVFYRNHNVMAELFLKAPIHYYSFTDMNAFCNQTSIPQADNDSCGSLCLSYLKNLLQDNARQLHEFSLSVPYYYDNNELQYFFVPSPYVLRYTQMSGFNSLLKGIIEFNEPISLNSKLVECIQKTELLEETEVITQAFKKDVIARAKTCLEILPEFKEKWLKEYARVDVKRALVFDKQNRYLAYTAYRLTAKSHLKQQRQKNPGLHILNVLQASTLSHDEVLHYLQLKLPEINFKTNYEIAYFLYAVGDAFRLPCFFLLQKMTFCSYSWHSNTFFLNAEQKAHLRKGLKDSPTFTQHILQEIKYIFSWLKILHFSAEEKIEFMRLHLPLDIAQKKLFTLTSDKLNLFVQQYCDTLNNQSFVLDLISDEVASQLSKSGNIFNSLLTLFEYIHEYFPAEVTEAFLIKHRFLLIQGFLFTKLINYYFAPFGVLKSLDPLFEKIGFFNLDIPNLIAQYHNLIKDPSCDRDGDVKILYLFNKLPKVIRSQLLLPTLSIWPSSKEKHYKFLIHALSAFSLAERYPFLQSVYGEKTDNVIYEHDLYFLFHDTKEFDLDRSAPSKEIRSRKRPYGDPSDFSVFFFFDKSSKRATNLFQSNELDSAVHTNTV